MCRSSLLLVNARRLLLVLLLEIELPPTKALVDAVHADALFVRAALNNASVLHHDDLI